MSREAFESWWQTIKNGWFYFSKLELAESAWKACEQHYAGRIAELEAKLYKEHHDAKTCPVCGVETATVEWIRERKELEAKLAIMAALVAKKDEALAHYMNDVTYHDDVLGLRVVQTGDIAKQALALSIYDII